MRENIMPKSPNNKGERRDEGAYPRRQKIKRVGRRAAEVFFIFHTCRLFCRDIGGSESACVESTCSVCACGRSGRCEVLPAPVKASPCRTGHALALPCVASCWVIGSEKHNKLGDTRSISGYDAQFSVNRVRAQCLSSASCHTALRVSMIFHGDVN